jgi:malate dehydrogenase (quinone)
VASVPAEIDVALIGGGIMSATLGTLLKQLRPDWSIVLFERLDKVARESSDGWNNAGTGHAALCELNYTPERADGTIDVSRAIKVNEQFHVSRQFWASLVEQGILPNPKSFIRSVPHMSFVRGHEDVEFLQRRYDAMVREPLFAGMEYSADFSQIARWIPLVTAGRDASEPIAVTRSVEGTDVDFGSMTRMLFDHLVQGGMPLLTGHPVRGLRKNGNGRWTITAHSKATGENSEFSARFTFVGAGGKVISLLQMSGIPEIKGYAGFPVSGQFLRSTNPELIATHTAKVYGKPNLGAPPMSAPHLDTRVIDGKPGVMFGPYAGFSPKLLKYGSVLDFFRSIRPDNILTMLAVAKDEIPLTNYLIRQVLQSTAKRIEALREFVPEAKDGDWELYTAGQRVQVMKPGKKKRGVLEFGTELITSADGSIAGLLGASPGASTATPIAIDLIERCFPGEVDGWRSKLEELVPSYGRSLSEEPGLLADIIASTDKSLQLMPHGTVLQGAS